MPFSAFLDRAFAYAKSGMIDEAMGLCSTDVTALINVGAMLCNEGLHAAALPMLRKAVELSPRSPEAVANLCAAYNELGRFQDAVDLCGKAAALISMPPELLNNFGNALKGTGRHEQALEQFRAASQSMPENHKLWMNLANTALELGRTDEAGRGYARAIDLSPHDGSYHSSLSAVHRYLPGDPHLSMMEDLLPLAEKWPSENRLHLDFALGKAYDDIGRYDSAMTHLLRGNALKRAATPYDEARVLSVFDAMEQTVTPAFLAEHGGYGNPSPLPVFIVGMPRSGTTLVEQILSSIPGVHGMGELMTFQACLSNAGSFPATGSTREWFDALGSAYIGDLGIVQTQFRRIIDKMPSNFIYAGLIHMALPNAKIVHLSRDPVDTCLSCFSRLFSGDQPFSYDLSELGRYWRRYAQLTDHWRRVLPKSAWLDVSYEALVDDLEGQARRLVEFAGLDWNPSCLSFHQTQRTVRTASAAQVRQPLYQSSVGRNRHYAPYLEPLVAALNGQ